MSNKSCPLPNIHDVRNVLSAARLTTYEQALKSVSPLGVESVLELYLWNSMMGGALFFPMHVCEVAIRNAVSDALTAVYGANWPWDKNFERSLKKKSREILCDIRRSASSSATGKVIAEMSFSFWQQMFVVAHDVRIWEKQLHRVLPNLDTPLSLSGARQRVHDTLGEIRFLRNRIAHHEPIFQHKPEEIYQKIFWIVNARCPRTANWMHQNQQVSHLVQSCPIRHKTPAS